MQAWRPILLLMLIALLPTQLVAAQFAPCPHAHESVADANAHHSHGHHQHDHHHGQSGHSPFAGGHDACPDCTTSTDTLQDTNNVQFHCDHCQCCHLAISPAVLSATLASTAKQTDCWSDTLTLSHYSRSIQPGLRPPLSLA